MRNKGGFIILFALVTLQACVFVIQEEKAEKKDSLSTNDTSAAFGPKHDSLVKDSIITKDSVIIAVPLPAGTINTKNVAPPEVVSFSKTLIGIPYKYGSTNPEVGFDCSGFITYVFSHFNIVVPRSSIDFTYVGKEIKVEESKPGDIILFTGTDSTEHFVGHMGIIVSNDFTGVNFIHSTSGKMYGVTITPLNAYYKKRYVKTIRIFPQNS